MKVIQNKIHYLLKKGYYFCNFSAKPSKGKYTRIKKKVTCLNCLHKLQWKII